MWNSLYLISVKDCHNRFFIDHLKYLERTCFIRTEKEKKKLLCAYPLPVLGHLAFDCAVNASRTRWSILFSMSWIIKTRLKYWFTIAVGGTRFQCSLCNSDQGSLFSFAANSWNSHFPQLSEFDNSAKSTEIPKLLLSSRDPQKSRFKMFPTGIQKFKTLRIRNGLGNFSNFLDQNHSPDLNLETSKH